ncbi:MAG: AsmA family protein [Pseudomonadota bacterium]
MKLRRAGFATALIVLIGGLFLLSLPVVLLPTDIKNAFARQVEAITGKPISVNGDVSISLFPRPTVTLSEVVFGEAVDTLPAVLRADVVRGETRFFPLLVGRIDLHTFELVRPVVDIVTEDDGTRNWAIYERETFDAISVANPRIGDVRIEDGTLNFRNAGNGIEFQLKGINAAMSWSRFGAPANLSGSANYNDRTIELQGSADRPVNLLFGGSTEINGTLLQGTERTALDGVLTAGSQASFTGEVDASFQTLSDTLSWAGADVIGRFLPDSFSVAGNVTIGADSVTFSASELVADDMPAEGSLSVRLSDNIASIAGTLAFESLQVDPIIAKVTQSAEEVLGSQSSAENEFESSSSSAWRGLANSIPEDTRLDLRVSAGTASFAGLQINNAAFSLTTAEQTATLSLANADIAGGALSGNLTLGVIDPEVELILQGLVQAVPVDATLANRLGLPGISGLLDATFDLQTAGFGPRDYRYNLTGETSLRLTDGTLLIPRDLDLRAPGLPRAISDIARSNILADRDLDFEVLETKAEVRNGRADVKDLRVETSGIRTVGEGSLDLIDSGVSLDLLLDRTDREIDQRLPVTIRGSVLEPRVESDLPQVLNLIRMQ